MIPIINESDQYLNCNAQLSSCSSSQAGQYCLFGFKWGEDPILDQSGLEVEGPKTKAGVITYSFQNKNGVVNTHRQVNVPSESWSEILSCARSGIKSAIQSWEEVANLTFKEMPDNSDSDVKFYVAAIFQSAVAYPNFVEGDCTVLAGNVIFDANSREKSCHAFRMNAMHEIGHVLGLGHVNSKNVMVADESKFKFDGLQTGDIKGIQELYGVK